MELTEEKGSESICFLTKERQTDTKWPLGTSEDSWGSRGRGFKSRHSDHWSVKIV